MVFSLHDFYLRITIIYTHTQVPLFMGCNTCSKYIHLATFAVGGPFPVDTPATSESKTLRVICDVPRHASSTRAVQASNSLNNRVKAVLDDVGLQRAQRSLPFVPVRHDADCRYTTTSTSSALYLVELCQARLQTKFGIGEQCFHIRGMKTTPRTH